MKANRFITNEIVSDERGLTAYKITRPVTEENSEQEEEIFYTEEVISLMFTYVKYLAEKQGDVNVRQCVISVPNWLSYDQKVMIRDAAESLANLSVL